MPRLRALVHFDLLGVLVLLSSLCLRCTGRFVTPACKNRTKTIAVLLCSGLPEPFDAVDWNVVASALAPFLTGVGGDKARLEALSTAEHIVGSRAPVLQVGLDASAEAYLLSRWELFEACGMAVFSSTCDELDEHIGSFCMPAFLYSLYILAANTQDRRMAGRNVDNLCGFLQTLWGPLVLTSLDIASSRWTLRAVDVVGLLESLGRLDCLVRRAELGDGARGAVADGPGPRRAGGRLRVVGVGGHNLVLGALLAAQEGVVAAGLQWEGGVYGYALRRNFSLSEASCAQLSAHVAEATGFSGPFCLDSPAIEEASSLIFYSGEQGAPLQEVQRLYREALSSDAFFRGADLALCVYPYFACAVLGALDAMADMPLAVLAQTTASLAEGAAPELVPWVLEIYKGWLREDEEEGAMRRVVALDPIFFALARSGLGHAPALVPFGAHHARVLAGGTRCELRSRPSPRLFLSKIYALLPNIEAFALHGVFDVLGWKAGWEVHMPNSYTYPELQTYTAALLVPWDWVLVTFSELYRIGLPLIVPEAPWMHGVIAMGTSYRRHAPETWRRDWKGRFVALSPEAWGRRSGARSRGAGNASGVPFIDSAPGAPPLLEQIAWWYAQTEYERFPLVRRFSSLVDLTRLLGHLGPAAEAMCRRMERVNLAALRQSRRFFRSLAAQVLRN